MKRKYLALTVLSFMIASNVAPFYGASMEIETDVAAQTETTITKEMPITKEIPVTQDVPLGTGISTIIFDDSLMIDNNVEIAFRDKKIEMEYRQLMDKRTITEDWYAEYKEFISLYSDKYDSSETIYDCFTASELDLLFRVVEAEIGDYSFEQRVNVANVIYNRIAHKNFGDEINEVLVSSQFATINNGRTKRVGVDEITILACEYAYEFPDTTNGALFFDSNGYLDYEFIYNDGAHNFYKLKN